MKSRSFDINCKIKQNASKLFKEAEFIYNFSLYKTELMCK